MPSDCRQACEGVDYVLHQAALGCVPRSMADPIATQQRQRHRLSEHAGGRARREGEALRVRRQQLAPTATTRACPRSRNVIGKPLSALRGHQVRQRALRRGVRALLRLRHLGLRYFNVFGPRQDPNGAYAAVIPQMDRRDAARRAVYINGDGETSRDFCYVDNVVQANLLAATTEDPDGEEPGLQRGSGRPHDVERIVRAPARRLECARHRCRVHGRCIVTFAPATSATARPISARRGALLGYAPTHTVAEGVPRSTLLGTSSRADRVPADHAPVPPLHGMSAAWPFRLGWRP